MVYFILHEPDILTMEKINDSGFLLSNDDYREKKGLYRRRKLVQEIAVSV